MSEPHRVSALSDPPPPQGALRRLHVLVEVALLGAAASLLLRIAMLGYVLIRDSRSASDVTIKAPVPAAGIDGLDRGPTGFVPGVELAGDAVQVTISNATAQQIVLAALAGLPTLVVFVTFLVLLLQVLRAARRREPFTGANARRLRFLGGFLVVGAIVASVAEMIIRSVLGTTVRADGIYYFDLDFPGYALIGGLGVIAMAGIVRRGAVLREELEAQS